MARLIDADELKTNCRITGEFMNNFECVSLTTLGEIIDKQPTIDPVKHGYVLSGVLDQVRWERDVAIEQLNSYGIQLGEKAELEIVKHGKWEEGSSSIRTKCSNCKKEYFNTTILEIRKSNYCPNCGADMRGE